MSEENSMNEYMDQVNDSMKEIFKGDIIEGTVISKNDEETIVNTGRFSDGIIPNEELAADDSDSIQVGDAMSLYVLDPHDKEGNMILSQKRAVEITAWEELEKAFEEKSDIHVTVKDVTKGGVVAFYNNIRCFIPGSLLSYRYVENMGDYVGKELVVRVEDFDKDKKRVILTRKAVEIEERKKSREALFEKIEVGKKYKGTVTKLMNYGAFVDIGGVEGLVHISDLSWNHIKHPSEVVSEGDEVEVYVLNFDSKKEKIGLGLKKVEDDPWNKITDSYQVGDIVEGKIVRLTDFGAFVEIEKSIEGLVHVSEISNEHVNKPADVLKAGDKVEIKILKIDEKNKKLSLSIKEAQGYSKTQESDNKHEKEPEAEGTTLGDLVGDKLKDFFKN